MMPLSMGRISAALWTAFGMYWVLAAKLQQRAQSTSHSTGGEIKTSDARSIRVIHHAMLAAAFILLFSEWTARGILGRRFLPATESVALLGLALTIAGLALAVWARVHLAENWSARVRIRVGHELVRTGPYAHLRHPIYSGVLLGVVGTAIVMGEWRGVIAVLVVVISYLIKGRREDAVLEREFGDTWREHRRHAGFLLPRF